MSIVVQSMASRGDIRQRDVFNRHLYQTVAATSAASAVTVDHSFYGITAATGSTHTASSQFELARVSAAEVQADGYEGRIDLTVNDGTGASAAKTIAQLAATDSHFYSTKLTSDFGSNFTSYTTKGVGQDGTTAASTQVFTTAAGGAGDVALKATANRLYVSAPNLDISGQATLQGDQLNWYQTGGVAGTKVSAANQKYIYTHNAGTVGTSTGVAQYNLDPLNVDGLQMASGAYTFNAFNAAGASEEVLSMGAGAAAGQQTMTISNSNVGIGQAGAAGYKLSVLGATKTTGDAEVTGHLVVGGDLTVSGTVTTINSTTVDVADKNITLGNGAITAAAIAGGGLTLGSGGVSGVDTVHYQYDNAIAAWSSDINQNVFTGKSYLIAGGTNTASDTGASLGETGLSFGADTATLALGTALSMDKSQLVFTDPNYLIKFGTTATLSKDGFSAASNSAAVQLGATKQWQMKIERISSDGGVTYVEYLALQHSTDGGVTYETKFSISP